MKMLVAVVVTAIVCIAGTYVAVGGGDGGDGGEVKLSISGSTTVQPLMVKYQEKYEKYANVTLEVAGGGSGIGATNAINGVSDIGMLSRELKDSEKAELKATIIAKDGVAVIVGSGAGVTNLTSVQVAKIFSGEITNWNEVGGETLTIAPVVREASSGTRGCFDDVMKTKYPTYKVPDTMQTKASTGEVVATVNGNNNAIGYISFGALPNLTTATAIKVDNIEPNVDKVRDGTYPVSRNLILATKGDPSGAAKKFIDWILGVEGQLIAQKMGFIAVKPTVVS